jgi:hypothetical protein
VHLCSKKHCSSEIAIAQQEKNTISLGIKNDIKSVNSDEILKKKKKRKKKTKRKKVKFFHEVKRKSSCRKR